MLKQIVFATNNAHKLGELRTMLAGRFRVVGLADIGCRDDIPEDADTFEGNALAKAQWVFDHYGLDCIADDSGLEVDALGGEPGIHSARYAGAGHDDAANNALLLSRLEGAGDRSARFRTVIAMVRKGRQPMYFHGTVEGRILEAPRGESGFGYDPLFVPEGWDKTFAEASADEKNSVSHRGRAVRELCRYLFRSPDQ
ncbi:MAG: RdgB/HAM1 family non-canonical purine NTP pyrophosphatase [Muribaculaceae bacterium]